MSADLGPAREFARRVWAARHEIAKARLGALPSQAVIVVGEGLWRDLMIDSRRNPGTPAVREVTNQMFIFDIPVELDRTLMPQEARFRSEVVL